MPIIKPLLVGGPVAGAGASASASIPLFGSSSSSSSSAGSSPNGSGGDHSPSASVAAAAHFMHSPPSASYAPTLPSGYGYGPDGGAPPGGMSSPTNVSRAAAGGATAVNASDLLLSFLTQTVRDMKEKITTLEDDNSRLRTKHRKMKRRLKDTDDRLDQLSGTVANLAQHPHGATQTSPSSSANAFASSFGSSATSSRPSPSSSSSSSSSSSLSSLSSSSASPFYGTGTSSYAYPLPPTTSRATKACPQQPQQQVPLQDFLDRAALVETSPSYGRSGLQAPSLPPRHHHQHQQQQQQQHQQQHQQQRQQRYSNDVADYAAPPVFSLSAAFQQQQGQQQGQQLPAMDVTWDVGGLSGGGLNLPSYSIDSISDIKRHFPYLDECYFEKSPFVIDDLRKPYLVMQFVSMESTVVTASEAYCSLSGFTLNEVCHTKKLVALLPRSYKRRMIPLFVHNNEPNTTTTLDTAGQLVRKDGQIVSLDYQMQFFFDGQGKVKWLFASIEKMVGVDKSFLCNNSDHQSEEERVKLLRDRLRDQEKQEWDDLIHEYLRSASVPALTLTRCTSTSSSSSSSSSSSTSSLSQQDLPPTSTSTTFPSSSSSSSSSNPGAGGLSATASSPPPPPVSPLSPMTTSWLAEMLATPSTTAPHHQQSASGMSYD